MLHLYAPDFVGKSENAVVMLVSSLDDELEDVYERFHRGEKLAYRFFWHLDGDNETGDVVILTLEFDQGEKMQIKLTPYHWDCFPYLLTLGYLVIMTDPGLLNEATIPLEPRALVIENAFWGLDNLARQAHEQINKGRTGNLALLVKCLAGVPGEDKKHH